MIAEQLTEQVYNCIKCGLCVNVCPVYEQLRFEGASPRGKVQLIKKILEGELEPSQNFSRLLFTCLLCETCTVACPGGLQPDRLMKAMRAEIIDQFGLPWQKRALFHLLSGDLLLPFCMFWGRTVGNSLRFLLPRKGKVGTIPYPRLPLLNSKPLLKQFPDVVPPQGRRVGRVLYFVGCATNYLFENVGRSVVDVLTRLGIEVVIPKAQVCCGLPICLSGARKMALKNIERNLTIFNRTDADTVITDCATCGAALKKEYPHILAEMGANAEAAQALSSKVLDISQFLAGFDLEKILKPVRSRVTYHDPCHLRRSQGVQDAPRNLLKRIPELEFVEMANSDVCCGGGGTFQWEHPDVASGITSKKIQAIIDTCPNQVATGCPGCRLQIHGNLGSSPIRVVHPVEILAEAIT